MFVWARIPDPFRHMGRWSFPNCCCGKRRWRCRRVIGLRRGGDEFVRFALVENEHRTRQALRGIRKVLNLDDQEP